jgi:hypothetical protein
VADFNVGVQKNKYLTTSLPGGHQPRTNNAKTLSVPDDTYSIGVQSINVPVGFYQQNIQVSELNSRHRILKRFIRGLLLHTVKSVSCRQIYQTGSSRGPIEQSDFVTVKEKLFEFH